MTRKTALTIEKVRAEFRKAATQLKLHGLPQRDLKNLTIVATDALATEIAPEGARLVICANRVNPERLPNKTARKVFGLKENAGGKFTGKSAECMVDVHVSYGSNGALDPFHTVCTAESEGWAKFRVDEGSTSNNNGYLWDLYKLLQVPSPVRLFVARFPHPEHLQTHVERLVRAYAHLYRPDDVIFSVVFKAKDSKDGDVEEPSIVRWEYDQLSLPGLGE